MGQSLHTDAFTLPESLANRFCPSLDGPNQLSLQHTQDGRKVVPPSEDPAVHTYDRIKPLAISEPGAFLDPIERQFGRAAKDRENSDLAQA